MLPDGWQAQLTDEQVLRVLAVEALADRGLFRYAPTDHPKGYRRVWLPPQHPYAIEHRGRPGHTHPYQFLHRYLAMREAGRVLQPSEHVHHTNGNKRTTDPAELEVLDCYDHATGHWHGRFYRGERVGCGGHIEVCGVCDGGGCFDCDHGVVPVKRPYD